VSYEDKCKGELCFDAKTAVKPLGFLNSNLNWLEVSLPVVSSGWAGCVGWNSLDPAEPLDPSRRTG
jgi:hypothetical protein